MAGSSSVSLSQGQPLDLSSQTQPHANMPMAGAQHMVLVRAAGHQNQTRGRNASWLYFGSLLLAWPLHGRATRKRKSHGRCIITCSNAAVHFSEPTRNGMQQVAAITDNLSEAAAAAVAAPPVVAVAARQPTPVKTTYGIPSGMTQMRESGLLQTADAMPQCGVCGLKPALCVAGVRHARHRGTSGWFTGRSSRRAERAAHRHVGAGLKAVQHQAVIVQPPFDPSKVRSKLQYGLSLPQQVTGTGSRGSTAQVSITRQKVQCGGVLAERRTAFSNLHSSE